jgi:hypothetical protein
MTMTDLRDVLDSAAGDTASPTPDVVAADVRRGRRALVRQRYARTGAGLLLTGAAVAAGVLVIPQLGTEPAQTHVAVAVPGAGGAGGSAQPAAVALVPFDQGAHPKPISPGLVPEGWSVSGSEFALVIAPAGSTTSPDDFRGKLVVTVSPDQTAASGATSVDVAGTRGTVSVESGTQILIYTPDGGRQVVVQAPAALGWDDATLARFGAAVTVSADAQAGRG